MPISPSELRGLLGNGECVAAKQPTPPNRPVLDRPVLALRLRERSGRLVQDAAQTAALADALEANPNAAEFIAKHERTLRQWL